MSTALVLALFAAATSSAAAEPGSAADVARRLGRGGSFLVGMGNDLAGADQGWNHDLDGAYTLGVTMDLHYAYLVGVSGEGGWAEWNPGGSFVDVMAETAARHGVTPMFTLYGMASRGDGNLGALQDAPFMDRYWSDLRLLFSRLGAFDRPALVHVEPDFWGYGQIQSGGDPSRIPARVRAVPECADLTDDLAGFGRCVLRLADAAAPKTLVAFSASSWAGSAEESARFLEAVSGGGTDLLVVETLDRDAGCFEARVDWRCQREDGPWYWDDAAFERHLDWASRLSSSSGKALLWWQMPFGVPSEVPGGAPGRYRDNRARYLVENVSRFVAAGGVGAVFGTGAENQTTWRTDGGAFQRSVQRYFAAPVPLPTAR